MVENDRMLYRHLGTAGVKVSALSFGNWLTGHNAEMEESIFQCVDACVRAGVNFLDTAELYGFGVGETMLGDILKRGGWPRDQLVISTKFIRSSFSSNPLHFGLSRKRLIQAARKSLKCLGLDYVDIMFMHRPDAETPIEESVRAITHLIEKGKADYWGTSEFTAAELMMVYQVCDRLGLPYPVTEQPQYNMLWRERVEVELGPLYDQFGLGTTVWSPLAGGLLSGKYNTAAPPEGSRYIDPSFPPFLRAKYDALFGETTKEKTCKMLQSLAAVATDLSCSQSQLCLAWTIANKDVSTAIFGATKPEQARENLGALDVLPKLTPEVLGKIEEILGNKPTPPLNWRTWTPSTPRR